MTASILIYTAACPLPGLMTMHLFYAPAQTKSAAGSIQTARYDRIRYIYVRSKADDMASLV